MQASTPGCVQGKKRKKKEENTMGMCFIYLSGGPMGVSDGIAEDVIAFG